MNIKERLEELFKDDKNVKVNKVGFRKEFDLNFLGVELDTKIRDSKEIVKYSRIISEYFDEHEPTKGEYVLDVYSAGTDTEVLPPDWEKEIGKFVKVHIENQKEAIIGKLTKITDETIVLSVRTTKRLAREEINKSKIILLTKYAKA